MLIIVLSSVSRSGKGEIDNLTAENTDGFDTCTGNDGA